MNAGRPVRRFHLPEVVPRPEGLAPETSRLLEVAVRQALADAVRAAGGGSAGTEPPPVSGGTRDAEREAAVGDGYEVPSYAGSGRPVTLPLLRPAAGQATGPAGGIGPRSGAGTGGRNLGGGARTAPGPRGAPAAPAARERPWTPDRLVALRTRMGHAYRSALLGRISADSLVVGSSGVRLVPALGGTDPERTVAARLGAGAFYLEPVARERVGLVAAAVPGAGFAVHQVTDDGRRHDTGLRVIARDAATVPAGVLAYTSDLTTVREVTIVGRGTGDFRAAAALIAADLDRGLGGAPGSVVAATMKDHLGGLDHDALMACFEELRRRGKLGEALALVRARAFRAFLHERQVPWTYVLANWEPNVADGAQVFSGVLWGAGENLYQVVEVIGILAGSVFSERLAQERHRFWTAIVTCVEHPLVTGRQGLRRLRDEVLEKLEQLEFFDAGRVLGQLVMTLLTLPEALASLPALGRGAVRAVVAVDRIGVAALDSLGLRLMDVVRFLLTEQPMAVTGDGVLLTLGGGDDLLVAGAKAKGTAALSKTEVVKALEKGERLFTPAEVEELVTSLGAREPKAPAGAEAAGGAGAVVLGVEALEDLVAEAIAELGTVPGSAELSYAVRGTRLHSAFARLVRARFPGSGLTVVSESALRSFSRLPAEILDLPIETYVRRTPGLAELERQLRPLFTQDGVPRLIGDLRPDLVVRAPGRLVVFDLASVERAQHMAKNMLYTIVLHDAGELVHVGETYWRHFGRTAAEIEALYPREFRAARVQREAAHRIARLHGAGKAP
ncbi:hypothetical protein ACFW6S_00350 [Streptomyces sp. NPDC058740]|uniref:hypothetical protein n=1 Tax=Streptomyces sp. NPDC058740 TaxID=3346619 RepID=UPI0036B4C0DE